MPEKYFIQCQNFYTASSNLTNVSTPASLSPTTMDSTVKCRINARTWPDCDSSIFVQHTKTIQHTPVSTYTYMQFTICPKSVET